MRRKDLDLLIFRWKKTTRALQLREQPYGKYITDLLEKRTDAELVPFSDPVEAAAFFCLLDLVKQGWTNPVCVPAGMPEPAMTDGEIPLVRNQRMLAEIGEDGSAIPGPVYRRWRSPRGPDTPVGDWSC